MSEKNNKTLKPGWRRVKFGDVVRLSKARSQDPLADGIERYVGLEHLEPGDLRIRSWGNVADGVTFTSLFQPGQVLFGKRRAYQRKVAVADFSGVCSGDIYVLETKDAQVLLPELLPFICQTDAFFDHAVGTSAGSLSPRTNWTSLADFEFALPPIKDQKDITLSLSCADEMIGSLQEAERAARNVFESTAQEFFESSSNNWPNKRIDEVSLFVTNGFVGKSAQHYVAEGGVPYLVSKNVRRNRLKLDEVTYISEEFHQSSKKSQLLEGDILTVQSGHIGETAVVPKEYAGANCHALIITRPDPKQLDPYFASYYLNSAVGQRRLSQLVIGSTIQHLNTSDLKKLDIPQPNIEEQKRISALLSSIASDQELLANRIEDAKRLRLQLLAEVFS
ncbi:restriction endonuclease subunit S [Halopseudomonas nanhaiensis]|uniref:restriction endonuclease subunit S n=1 Tax=Halopseudomonas nanhaiensis TaxID=2830842 RepID=UPI001CBE36EE|nr:restriction endonuclease subunit S [Halopseudomonas nanhaiensis]UAW99804.1 restriction endonuclease subunit S [Halopseudomonas nanhaiensis]